MSSRNRVIPSVTLILLLFGQCCWSLWIRTRDTSDTLNSNLLLANEYSNDLNGVDPPQQHIPRGQQKYERGPTHPLWPQQAIRFLQGNAVEQKMHLVSSNLRNLLKENIDGDLPIVYDDNGGGGGHVEDEIFEREEEDYEPEQQMRLNEVQDDPNDVDVVEYEINEQGEMKLNQDKRSGRYYRRYPFKRRNNRYYETPKQCKPSREEVVKLLIELHKYQNGNKDRKDNVRFCKRDRPLGNIITNIRFLG